MLQLDGIRLPKTSQSAVLAMVCARERTYLVKIGTIPFRSEELVLRLGTCEAVTHFRPVDASLCKA